MSVSRRDWKIFRADEAFFKITKKIHNLLHLETPDRLGSREILDFLSYTFNNYQLIDTAPYDIIFIHDPQPIGLIVKKKWEPEVDLALPYRSVHPYQSVLRFIEAFSNGYDASIFHVPEFVPQDFEVPPSLFRRLSILFTIKTWNSTRNLSGPLLQNTGSICQGL